MVNISTALVVILMLTQAAQALFVLMFDTLVTLSILLRPALPDGLPAKAVQ